MDRNIQSPVKQGRDHQLFFLVCSFIFTCFLFCVEDNQCSRCDALEEECTLLRTERDFIKGKKVKFEEEIKTLNKDIEDLRSEHTKEKKTLQREIQVMREEHENLTRDFEKELQKMLCEVNEQQIAEMKILQGKNEELNELLKKQKSEVQKISAQLKKEKSNFEKAEDEFVKVKKNLAREKKKLKEAKEGMAAEAKGKTDALRELAKLKVELGEKEKQKEEDFARLRKDFLDRCHCEALREEIARLRSMPGRKYGNCILLVCTVIGLETHATSSTDQIKQNPIAAWLLAFSRA